MQVYVAQTDDIFEMCKSNLHKRTILQNHANTPCTILQKAYNVQQGGAQL